VTGRKLRTYQGNFPFSEQKIISLRNVGKFLRGYLMPHVRYTIGNHWCGNYRSVYLIRAWVL